MKLKLKGGTSRVFEIQGVSRSPCIEWSYVVPAKIWMFECPNAASGVRIYLLRKPYFTSSQWKHQFVMEIFQCDWLNSQSCTTNERVLSKVGVELWISITAWFARWDLFITAQIVVLYCWDWHAEISTTIHNCSHWNKRVFRTWGYHGNITTFAIQEILLLSCVRWKRKATQRAYVRYERDRVVADVGKRNSPRSSPRDWM